MISSDAVMCYACGTQVEGGGEEAPAEEEAPVEEAPAEEAPAEEPAAEGGEEEIACPSCGTMISSDAVMCYACGTQIEAGGDEEPKKVSKKRVV